MRQTHLGGEKVFVDFAGHTIDIFDPITGEAHPMKLFVAAMGASTYTYAEACPSESLPDWIGVHTNLFTFLGGVPKFVVCDNLRAAVTNPDRYDPGLRWRAITAPQFSQPGRDVAHHERGDRAYRWSGERRGSAP